MKFLITFILSIVSIMFNVREIDDAKVSANIREEELILASIETSYATSIMKNSGQLPTLNNIKENLSIDNASWVDDKIKTESGVVCTVKVENSLLKVDCPTKSLDKELKLKD